MLATWQAIPRHQLDTQRWDTCIATSKHTNIFMYSWALDILCEQQWQAFVYGDYIGIAALPVRKKWHLIRYAYQVPFLPYCSVISTEATIQWQDFYRKVKSKFSFLDITCDWQHTKRLTANEQLRTNYYLPQGVAYELIANNYSTACKKNLRKAQQRGVLTPQKSNDTVTIDLLLQVYDNAYGGLQKHHHQRNYNTAKSFMHKALAAGWLQLYTTYDSDNQLLHVAAMITYEHKHWYYMAAPTTVGREKRVTYAFIDFAIAQACAANASFDFVGSDIANVATFYRSFSPETQYLSLLKAWLL
ncbi:MAG TPA: hypothetical protein DCL43_12800 [Chitinophagaceae bacterium]|nr:hypothetical protein [Chitinophagaceae bacterium]HAN39816.1 hypothetical protein [Chitinophagaceae bacterium]